MAFARLLAFLYVRVFRVHRFILFARRARAAFARLWG
jgi:hypothetical protein